MKVVRVWINLMKRNILYCLLLVLEVVIVSFILLSMVGKMQAVADTRHIDGIFDKTNSYYFTPYSYYESSSKEINTMLQKTGAKEALVTDVYMNINGEERAGLGYNEEAFDFLNIAPSSGEWIDSRKKYGNIPIICVGDTYNVGDVLHSGTNRKIKFLVVGKISKSQYIMWYKKSASSGKATLSNMLEKAAVDFLVPYECANLKCVTRQDVMEANECGSRLLLFDKMISTKMQNKICEYGDLTGIEEMCTNYKAENEEYFIVNGIALIIFSLIMFAGIGGINSMMEIRNEKRLTIYYILGCSKRKCMMLELFRAISPMIIGFSLFVVLYTVKGFLFFIDEHITINISTFLFIFIYVLLIYSMTCIPFSIRLGRKNLLDLYKQKV